jgi:hypothetical protein
MRRTIAALAIAAGCLVAPASAGAVTATVGQVAPPASSGACFSCTMLQVQTDAVSYTVPAGNWTLTNWSIRGGATMAGNARLRIFRPTGMTDQWRLVAESAEMPVPASAVTDFPVSIPVQGGDVLGLRTGAVAGDIAANYPGGSAMDVSWLVVGDPTLNQTVGPGGDITSATQIPTSRVNVAATVFRADPASPSPTPTPTPPPTKKKCKKKKVKKHSAAAAKKKCKKKKR